MQCKHCGNPVERLSGFWQHINPRDDEIPTDQSETHSGIPLAEYIELITDLETVVDKLKTLSKYDSLDYFTVQVARHNEYVELLCHIAKSIRHDTALIERACRKARINE